MSDHSARPYSVVTIEEPEGVEQAGDDNTDLAGGSSQPASGDNPVADSAARNKQLVRNAAADSTEAGVESSNGSANASNTGGKHRSGAGASHGDSGGSQAGSSANGAGKHSAERKFGHHK